MKRYRIGKFLLALAFLSIVPVMSCGGGGSSGPPETNITIYVNATSGDDGFNGSTSYPYRTITKALSVIENAGKIVVQPGTYDGNLGEQFPIRVKPNVILEGDVAAKGNGTAQTLIQGAGSYLSSSLSGTFSVAVVCDGGATVHGFHVTAPSGIGVWSESPPPTGANITDNTITGSDYGILIAGLADARIRNNVITQNSIAGIEALAQSKPLINDNAISQNGVGIEVRTTSQPDIGSSEMPGDNMIAQNTQCDLNNETAGTISAIGNNWDDDQFFFTASSICSNGANIANTNQGVVLFQYIPLATDPVFPGASAISATAPANGTILLTTEPHFTWTAPNSNYVMVCLFKRPIQIQNSTIKNTSDIVWLWHSGLPNGTNGDVSYLNGVSIVNGDLGTEKTPSPLDRGRTYYWAIWAWNEEGITITRSSPELYFIISN